MVLGTSVINHFLLVIHSGLFQDLDQNVDSCVRKVRYVTLPFDVLGVRSDENVESSGKNRLHLSILSVPLNMLYIDLMR